MIRRAHDGRRLSLVERVRGVLLSAAACVAALALPACSDGFGTSATDASSAHPVAGTAADAPTFLALMTDAPERVAHSGLRRVAYRFDVDGVPTALVYEERVTSAGDGRHAIVPVTILEPSLSTTQREVFEELQRARQGFFFQYRDLRVRDVALFLANYSVHVVPGTPVVAGVECVELEVTPLHVAPGQVAARTYRMSVDPTTGLVMSAVERDGSGVETASTTFLDFTRTPTLDDVPFHTERYPGTPLQDAPLPAGFVPKRPQILPTGYRELSSDVLSLAGDTYVRRVYGDGLENVFFLQRSEPGAEPVNAAKTYTVRMAEVGGFRVAEVARTRGSLFVVGKISEADVLGILRSAL